MSLDTSFPSFRKLNWSSSWIHIIPIPFLLCTNGLPYVSKIPQFHIYADDTSISYIDSDLNSPVNIVNQELPIITEWFTYNYFRVNGNKSTAMLCLHVKKLYIDNTAVPFSISTKLPHR